MGCSGGGGRKAECRPMWTWVGRGPKVGHFLLMSYMDDPVVIGYCLASEINFAIYLYHFLFQMYCVHERHWIFSVKQTEAVSFGSHTRSMRNRWYL